MPDGEITGERIAIAGAGVAGSYLYRMLKKSGADFVDVFSKREKTACGIHSCAWLTGAEIFDLLRVADIDPAKFIIGHHKRIKLINRMKKGDIYVIDKPRLIEELIEGASIKYSKPDLSHYDRVIDATGAARALLPPARRKLACTAQYRIKANRSEIIEIQYIPEGYAWIVPLGEGHFHLGYVSKSADSEKYLEKLFDISAKENICYCRSEINMTPPENNLPFVNNNIWGIGEAIGCVSPLIGEGILPALESVAILLKHWGDPEEYTRDVLRNFRWIGREYKIFRSVENASPLALMQYPGIKKCFKRYKIDINLLDILKILKRVMQQEKMTR